MSRIPVLSSRKASFLKKKKKNPEIERVAMENEYLGARMKHAADIGSDAILDVVEGSVVPLRVSRISPKSWRCR